MISLACITVGCLLWGDITSDAAKKELEKLQGKWTVERIESSTSKIEPKPGDEEITLEFKGTKVLLNDKEQSEVIDLGADVKPLLIDVRRVDPADKVDEGIFKLEDDTLTIAINLGTAKKRPVDFEVPKDDGVVVVVFKRKK